MEHEQQIKVPGFGLPLKHILNRNGEEIEKEENRFPHAIADYHPTTGITLREKRMLDFINHITDKPRWQEKVYDAKIVEKWRLEACGSIEEQETSPNHLSRKAFDYCIEELKDKAAYHQKYGVIHVLDVEVTIVKTDIGDGEALCSSLVQSVRPLEDVSGSRKDWHPGSDEIVLDLVHPSLFPLQYGKSRVLPSGSVPLSNCNEFICRGVQCPTPKELSEDIEGSIPRARSFGNADLRPWGSYQWLPSDISLGVNGAAKIESYINNLHPQQHSELYPVLEKAVAKAVPLWNECLSFFHSRLRIRVDGCDHEDFRYPGRDQIEEGGSFPMENMEEIEGKVEDVEDIEDEVEDTEESEEEAEDMDIDQWVQNNATQRKLDQCEPADPFLPFEERAAKEGLQRVNLAEDFSNWIQVIFKLANIHLTPDKPYYNGNEWHIEGALNERICATALVYYDQDNIEDSYLAFRQEVDTLAMLSKHKAGQYEYEAVEDMFGIEKDGAPVQDLGKVATTKGRILAFPNTLQHRVLPFGLADPTKRGYRKILAMFLVDPHVRILSTSNVPPQRRDWWAEEVRSIRPFSDLPVELFNRLIQWVEDFPISFESACEAREALMAERGRVKDDFDDMLDTVGSQ